MKLGADQMNKCVGDVQTSWFVAKLVLREKALKLERKPKTKHHQHNLEPTIRVATFQVDGITVESQLLVFALG